MTLPVRYLAGSSAGTPFETGETNSVVVTAEALDKVNGYVGETVVYTATVKDVLEAALPATFVASLKINGTVVITDQVFDAEVYDPETKLLTLSFTVPAPTGELSVVLDWAQQDITIEA
ncbi:unnamed protein product [marine sediment metagenome]|uniref:SbsA Ig-like domain-containing protein n=1 Tax=marine sediment metagenome TaxID=412755 RepID=X1NKV7_9ZZZZ